MLKSVLNFECEKVIKIMANVSKCILFKTIEEINYFFPYQIIARTCVMSKVL